MLVEDVKKLDPKEIFWYWCKQRQQILLKKRAGHPRPWTDDTILQTLYMTNVYREDDKCTVWFRENVRERLRNSYKVIFATMLYRWFVWNPTGEILLKHGLFDEWDARLCLQVLGDYRDAGNQIFTGAYVIGCIPGTKKLEGIVQRLDVAYKTMSSVAMIIETANRLGGCTLQYAHEVFKRFPGYADFMAYEIVTDLRHTYLLENAPDINTWCSLGPGGVRGLFRLNGLEWPTKYVSGDHHRPNPPKDWLWQLQLLLLESRKRLPRMPPFEMREIESACCEYDKYCRELYGDGHSKRRYLGA